jgi:uncharacterized protein
LTLEFDWDEQNTRHICRHGVSPREFEEAMRNKRVFIRVDEVGGEDRWYMAGATNGLRILELAFTYREDKIRPVTARDARKDVRELYFISVGEKSG